MTYGTSLYAQIKVGNNPGNLNANAVLEIESSNKGLLLPRLALTSTTSPSPMNAFIHGMIVYNTATQNDIMPGMYYSDGVKWLKMIAGAIGGSPAELWSINGNNGTNSATHFLGTTNNTGLRFRTNNIERMSIGTNGWVGIGTSSPAAALEVKGEVIIDTLLAGNAATDNILVANANGGKVKSIPASSFIAGAQKRMEVVVVTGQTIFNTPAPITDSNRIMLYRNGIQISFTVNTATSIVSEVPCVAGDEIRIIQLL
ncbi:MAG: hypothetical protein HOP10_04300 [Chitinophagaceae bacterium]|nr:hypothetical protein [Chitinophagaceae bacterium]